MNKKKKMLTLVALLVVLALAGVLVVLLMKNKKPEEQDVAESETVNQEAILQVSADAVTSLSFKTEGFDQIDAVKENGTWTLLQDKDCPVDQNRLDAMVRAVLKIKADKEIDSTDDESMGFNAPHIDIKFTASGKDYEVLFGKSNATNDAYYTKVVGEDKVYLVSNNIRFSFERTITDLVYVEEIPVFEDCWIKKFTVVGKGKEEVYTYFEKEGDDGKMYPAYNTASTGLPASSNTIAYFLGTMSDMTLKKAVDYNVSAEDLENKYGFAEPDAAMFVEYEDANGQVKNFGLIIGDVSSEETDAAGNKTIYHYAMVQGVNIVYTIAESGYAEMIGNIFQE